MRVATVLFVFLAPALASGYELTGSSWRMGAYPSGVPYCPVINALDATSDTMRADFAAAVDAAMLAWTEAGDPAEGIPGIPCSAYRADKRSCAGSPSQADDQHWIWWEADWSSVPGVGSSTIGVTPWWSSGTEIVKAKVIFNDRDYYWSVDGSATDVGSIAVHELGHFVGVDHYDEFSSVKEQECFGSSYPSVMCSGYGGGVARIPTADDILAVCYLYPLAGALGSACSSGGSCVSGSCHADGYCTQSCPPSCPLGYECVGGECEREQPPPTCPTCATLPCGVDSVCIGASGGAVCTSLCSGTLDCPSSFYCAPLDEGGGVCWPLGNRCEATGPVAGQACVGDWECAFGNVCLELPNGERECFTACREGADCAAANQRCYTLEPGIGYCDVASTSCSCDVDDGCTPTCACDADCVVCGCNSRPGVCEACGCDPDCSGCLCDGTPACDADCPCDPECGCACDRTYACDGDCECDPECSDGCAAAPYGSWSMVVLVPWVVRRRRAKRQASERTQ